MSFVNDIFKILRKNKGKWMRPEDIEKATGIEHKKIVTKLNTLFRTYPNIEKRINGHKISYRFRSI